MAAGPKSPPVTSGVDLTKAPFKKCSEEPATFLYGYHTKNCKPGTHGRYMYIYNERQEPSALHICEINFEAHGRYQTPIGYH